MCIYGWNVEETIDVHTGASVEKDVFKGKQKIKTVSYAKYLGDIISWKGNNELTIKDRTSRGMGIIKDISHILNNTYFGKYFFQSALILRNALLISSLLTNCETWMNIRQKDINALSMVDHALLRKILDCPQSTPIEIMYGDLGCWPIEWLIRSRRLNYLKHILGRNKKVLINRVFQAQY